MIWKPTVAFVGNALNLALWMLKLWNRTCKGKSTSTMYKLVSKILLLSIAPSYLIQATTSSNLQLYANAESGGYLCIVDSGESSLIHF